MPQAENPGDRDVERVRQELAGRLSTRGIEVPDGLGAEEVEDLMAAVEEFEDAVEAAGGDLMVDEPPRGASGQAQPDDPMFLLPTRTADESVARYIERLAAATEAIRARDQKA
ncbi:MAG TPA: hypothetical protein VFO55_05370 [Gemmatimonadaceae bacterium]|nr:hypothetical protein [Gemmatimonadaceae bacterium]